MTVGIIHSLLAEGAEMALLTGGMSMSRKNKVSDSSPEGRYVRGLAAIRIEGLKRGGYEWRCLAQE